MTVRPILPLWTLITLGVMVLVAIILLVILHVLHKRNCRVSDFRRLTILGLVIVALLRPSIITHGAEAAESNMNIFFAVDMTGSMVGKDCKQYQMRRYEKAAQDINKIAEGFAGARYAVFVQDFAPYPASPLTTDLNAIKTITSIIHPKSSMTSTGSDMQSLFDMVKLYIKKYKQSYPDRQTILIYLSDGEETGDTTVNAEELKNLIVGGAVLGYGTEGGVEIEEIGYDGSISEGYFIRDENYEKHVSKMNEGNLQSIASQLNVKFYNMTNMDTPSEFFQNTKNEVSKFTATDTASYEDLYWLIALLIIALLLWEFFDISNKLLSERSPQK